MLFYMIPPYHVNTLTPLLYDFSLKLYCMIMLVYPPQCFGNFITSELRSTGSAAEFRKYCKRLHVDLYTKCKRLHAKYSIVHVVYLPFDNV